jgi:hypothetical protein
LFIYYIGTNVDCRSMAIGYDASRNEVVRNHPQTLQQFGLRADSFRNVNMDGFESGGSFMD